MEKFWRYRFDHVIFWVATVGFHMFTKRDLASSYLWQFVLEVIVRNGLLAVIIYLNLLVLIPRYARRQKWLLYFSLVAADLGFYVLTKNLHDLYLSRSVLEVESLGFFDHSFYNLSIAFFYMAFGVALQLSREWYMQKELIRRIEVEKLNTELDYLKAQINPHFLFNSINTIYFLIDKRNEEARETLSSFSQMLRYQLYECNGREIAIEKEISYLKSYVALQRLRRNDNFDVSFTGEELTGFFIAPLLLIPFVENAFKHVSDFRSGNKVLIDLRRHENKFRFRVLNSTDHAIRREGGKGIGLRNVQRRLELLYNGRHSLIVDDRGELFEVNLEITLN